MKILLVHDKDLGAVARGRVASPDAGGLAVYIEELARGLRQRGHALTTLDFRPGAEAAVDRRADDLHLPGFRQRYNSATVSAFERVVLERDPDLIHVQSVTSMHPRLIARLSALRPVVWTIHDASPVCYRRTLLNQHGALCERSLGHGCLTSGCYRIGQLESAPRDMLRLLGYARFLRALCGAQLVTVPSEALRTALVRNGVPATSVRVMPLFSRFEPQALGAPDSPGSPGAETASRTCRLLFVGRLSEEKGVPQLLAAAELLEALVGPNWELALAGGGSWESAARECVEAAGLGARVRIAGELDRAALQREYERCDLVCVPSMAPESFGLTGVEAHAFGKPVVAFAAGGVNEWLTHRVNGIAVPHGDVEALAQALAELVLDAPLRRHLGAAGQQVQRERFTRQRHLQAVEKAYAEVLAGSAQAVGRGA